MGYGQWAMGNIPFRTDHRKIHISPSFLDDSHLGHINNNHNILIIIIVIIIIINSSGFTVLQEPGISVGKATRYWLEGPGIEFPVGARFCAPVETSPRAQPASYTIGTGSVSRG
jgi:hypothetical protein